ncbi:MAG: hypothetical protein VX796_09305 [Pseudomonadota bacterium]|nr:hypothetical protein [Pseudomonadota bacterium]
MSALIQLALQLVGFTGLGGKLGHLLAGDKGEAIASKIVGIAQAVTGQTKPEDALATLNGDKDKRAAFEDAVYQHAEEMEGMASSDRADARDLAETMMASANAGWFARNFVYLAASALILWSLAFLTTVTFVELSPTGERYADLAVNVVIAGGAIGAVMKFLFGGGADAARQKLGGKALRDLKEYGR